MRFKTSSTLIAFPHGKQIAILNYLSKSSVICDATDMKWLTDAPDWTEESEIVRRHSNTEPASVSAILSRLTELGLLVRENTEAAARDAAYCRTWSMGRAPAFLHFLAADNTYVDTKTGTQSQIEQARTDPSPELYRPNDDNRITLPVVDETDQNAVFGVMRRRRTNRFGLARPVLLQHIADCLHAGLGITGFVRTETAVLPLKMTPSGGARNPFEAFLIARNVDGLAPGVYHYAAIDHTLGPIRLRNDFDFGDLLSGQEWTNSMSALVVLAASLDRTSWKYKNPNAYRVVLIEAGHIAQNMMLVCTSHGLTACPTAALAHSKLSTLLGLEHLTDVPLYALAIGHPGADPDQVISVEDYLALKQCNGKDSEHIPPIKPT
jgi:SagB-type dehydrogenase family enzyme